MYFGCKNGRVYELSRPNPKKIDNSDSYYWHDAQFKMWEIKLMESQMEKNQKKDEAEVDVMQGYWDGAGFDGNPADNVNRLY